MERFEVDNRFGPPTPMIVSEIPPAELTEPFRLIYGIEAELVACYQVCLERGGYRVAEAVTYGCPDGIRFRLTLVGAGMRSDVWERLLPAEASIGEMFRDYWADPSVVAVRG